MRSLSMKMALSDFHASCLVMDRFPPCERLAEDRHPWRWRLTRVDYMKETSVYLGERPWHILFEDLVRNNHESSPLS